VIGRCGDIVGVWMPPVGAQVMMTDFERFAMSGTRALELPGLR
jgi:hypothetical protein